jgi:hypothetical protein
VGPNLSTITIYKIFVFSGFWRSLPLMFENLHEFENLSTKKPNFFKVGLKKQKKIFLTRLHTAPPAINRWLTVE